MAFNYPPSEDKWYILFAPFQTKFPPHVISWFCKDGCSSKLLEFSRTVSLLQPIYPISVWPFFPFTNVCGGLCYEKCGTEGFVCQWGNRFSMAIFDQVAVSLPLRVPGGGRIATIWPDSPSPTAKHTPMKPGWNSKGYSFCVCYKVRYVCNLQASKQLKNRKDDFVVKL